MKKNHVIDNSTVSGILETSEKTGVKPQLYAALRESMLIGKPELWLMHTNIEEDNKTTNVNFHLTDMADFLTKLSVELATQVKFPVASVHLHSLGVISSAMNKSFSFSYYNTVKPCNLYVVTGQPPSTGKSGVNDTLLDPIYEAYDALNKSSLVTRKRLEIELEAAEKELSRVMKEESSNDYKLDASITRVSDVESKISALPHWIPALDDTTPEAAENVASQQTGMFNIISAEHEAIETILGGMYSDKANYGIFLKAWDGERISVARVGRDGFKGKVRASIAVTAQNTTIEKIMQKATEGRGIPERFLMLNEPNLLGSRDHNERINMSKDVVSDYGSLIRNIVNESNVLLNISAQQIITVNNYRNKVEPLIADGGEYDAAMLTGFIGKADKHIYKLACVYHVSVEWMGSGKKNKNVSDMAINRAIHIFDQLRIQYAQYSANLGFSGDDAQVAKIASYLTEKARKGQIKITLRDLVQNIKGAKEFSGSRNLSSKLLKEIIPILEDHNYCVIHKKTIFTNPRLK